MNRARESFFSLPALVVMGVLIALVLYILFPRQAVFEDVNYLDNPDGLSIAYLEVLLRSDSDNDALRINLAHMLRESGQFERAARVLSPLLEQDPVPAMAFENYLTLMSRQVFAQPPGPAREARRHNLFRSTQRVLNQDYSFERKLELLSPAQSWLTSAQYLMLIERMLADAPEPGQQWPLARQIARLQEAEGRPGAAAQTLENQLNQAAPERRDELVSELIRLELASGDAESALALFKTYRVSQPMTVDNLTQGISLARMAGAPEEERRWLMRLAVLKPDDLSLQRELLSTQLGAGNLPEALATARRLQRRPLQLTSADRQRIAQVLEWNNLPSDALPVWLNLYRDTGQPESYRRAKALALTLYQRDALIGLLNLGERRGQLSSDDYETLADALVRNGQLAAARQRLQQGLRRHPQSSGLKQRQLALMLNMRDYPAAIDLLTRQNRLTDAERVQLADLYWRTRQPEKALAQLDFEPGDASLSESVHAMRLDLALVLGQTQRLRQEYQALLASGPNTDPQVQERLLNMAVLFEDYPEALRLSERRFRQTGEFRYLAAMAEYQLALKQWDALETTLGLWANKVPEAGRQARYWSLLALLYHQRDELMAANDAYRKAYNLAPDDEDILISWSWLQLANASEFSDSLPHLLARLSERPSPAAYPVLAYGYSALNDTWVARHWFTQGLNSRTGDVDWLVATARVLDQTGSPGMATALRQQALELSGQTATAITTRLALYESEGLERLAWRELALFVPGTADDDDTGAPEVLANYALRSNNAIAAETLLRVTNLDKTAGTQRSRALSRALYPQPEDRRTQAVRLNTQLDRLDGMMTGTEREALALDTMLLHQSFPRAVQVGTEWQSLGNFSVQKTGISGQYSRNRYTLFAETDTVTADGRGRLRQAPDQRQETTLRLARPGAELSWQVTAQQLPRYQTLDTAAAIEASWQGTDAGALTGGFSYQERTPDSAEAWWLTARDRAYISANYSPFSRLNLSSQLESLSINSVDNTGLGDGYGVDLTATYTLFRQDPAWTLSAGYRRQQLSLTGALPATIANALAQPLVTNELLTRNYERVSVTSRWFHGEPHALYRSAPSPRAFFGLGAGYVLSTSTPDFGLELGLGWRVIGDDELALSGRWSSEGLDGNGRTDFNLTYTMYLGR